MCLQGIEEPHEAMTSCQIKESRFEAGTNAQYGMETGGSNDGRGTFPQMSIVTCCQRLSDGIENIIQTWSVGSRCYKHSEFIGSFRY